MLGILIFNGLLYDIMILQQYHTGHEVVIHYDLAPWCEDIGTTIMLTYLLIKSF